ncbi:MAG TPA: undecaprenyl-diphosphate phosphatase [Vicinamibacterales bacterium]|nr:undecaprenyl-diphosphate phosphatase [Vicinamibacterales bacterium]
MSFAAAVLLGAIQGLTEFLPVSSSAHLLLARAFFGWELPPEFGLAFDVAVHVGTLAAILVYFRAEIAGMTLALPGVLAPRPSPPAEMLRLIAIGTIPVVAIALAFNDIIEQVLRTPAVAAAALAVGAALMLAAERLGPRTRVEDSIGWGEAVLIGCAQAAALIPGMSRSGTTIAIGMFLGLRRDAAARFTFLLAIPAMLAAAAKEGIELATMPLPAGSASLLTAGIVVSAVVGYVTIKYFLRFLGGHKLDVFAVYRLLLAAVTVAWLLK